MNQLLCIWKRGHLSRSSPLKKYLSTSDNVIIRKGFDAVLERTKNILKNVHGNEKFMKILHIQSSSFSIVTNSEAMTESADAHFPLFFGKARKYQIQACSDDPICTEHSKSIAQYSSAELVDFSAMLPFRASSFDAVVCLHHPSRDITQSMVPPKEISRLITHAGFGILGYPKALWFKENKLDELAQNSVTGVEFMLAQALNLDDGAPLNMRAARANGKEPRGQTLENVEQCENAYIIAVLKRV